MQTHVKKNDASWYDRFEAIIKELGTLTFEGVTSLIISMQANAV